VPRPTARESRGETRGRWGATDADSVLLFMGRPHPHKGFDRFAAWSRHARGAGSRLMFVSAGSEASWPGLDLSGIVAVGYQADPAAAYLAADLVLFPNRKAYLDFGLLQCLSLGVPVAVSPVGGHAALVRECTPIPVIPPGDGDEVVPWLEKTASAGLPPDYRERVVRLWEERFSPLPFVLGHADAARRLLGV
jgi:glycosyltransferase involved in cell wall biosynthesis